MSAVGLLAVVLAIVVLGGGLVLLTLGVQRGVGGRAKDRSAAAPVVHVPTGDGPMDPTTIPLVWFQQWTGNPGYAADLWEVSTRDLAPGRRLTTFHIAQYIKRDGQVDPLSRQEADVALADVPEDWPPLVVAPGKVAAKTRSLVGHRLRLDRGDFARQHQVFGPEQAFADQFLSPPVAAWWEAGRPGVHLEIGRGLILAARPDGAATGDAPPVDRWLEELLRRVADASGQGG